MHSQYKYGQWVFALLFLAITTNANAKSITLHDDANQISISPRNLEIDWNGFTINSQSLRVNKQPQKTSALIKHSATYATWSLQPSGISVSARLANGQLQMRFLPAKNQTILRGQPIRLNWFDLPQEKTETLYLPFSEGMRIPTDNKDWADYLVDNYTGSNTTQDLKMPFWTTKQKDTYISYHLLNVTNNVLSFSNQAPRVDMQAQHQFTLLNQNSPFIVNIRLGNNWMDGAKAYRNWRIEQNQSITLAEKKTKNPALSKLIGASQVYLFGEGLISVEDVKDWWGLKKWYFVDSALKPMAIKALKPLQKGRDWLSHYHKQLLVDSLNESLQLKFSVASPTLNNNTIEDQYNAGQQQKHWLAINASKYLIAPKLWGQGLSFDIITNLQQAGLTKLWLGVNKWKSAFYQPQVVDQAKAAGYLVATYDSYNTAIPEGLNDDWLTARLPDRMRNECSIELASGEKKKGFRGNGYYLNPNCRMSYVKQRVLDVIKYGRFNSLFLDVDATAMAREDYRANSNESDMLSAFNQRMSWIAQQDNIVLGSEDGNSLTTQGIVFAHGLESVGFGWTDSAMKDDSKSPYFLGRWYPNHKPAFFFKTAKVKEPYKTLLFSPKYRIPLYQAVFHDEVINSYHWHNDSLKFSNVKIERDLISMLYNTPPMVHLTRDEASSINSSRIKSLAHYQKGYRPIHEQLWDKQLTSFKWLDKRGDIQQTTFSDGTTIIANFKGETVTHNSTSIAPYSILANLVTGKEIVWKAK